MPESYRLLVVDDDTAHRTMLRTLVGGWGYTIAEADDGDSAIEAVQAAPVDLVLMDIRMVRVSGIEALERIKSINPAIPIVLMTAYASVDMAVEALKKGAYDYLIKPLDFDKLRLTLTRSLEHIHLKRENQQLKDQLATGTLTAEMIGSSPAMVRLMETVAQVAVSEATVMITGESGTGKELVAAAIHTNSPRKAGPLVKVNCAAITETLLESELFGHEKGAFTGADRRKEGRFVQAHGGSLFLDEVGEMPIAMQVKLLRVLQERELTRVGGDQVIAVDVRLIVATNRDLARMVNDGTFREDLYYRLNVVELQTPPLRQRREDIPLLATHFLNRFAEKNHKTVDRFSPRAMDLLIRHDWPGNVRELMNTIERAVVLSRSDCLDEADFHVLAKDAPDVDAAPSGAVFPTDLPLEQIEREAIANTLSSAGGNKSEAARRLGITRKTLREKIKKYNILQ
ncbi:acetoacetate metabolism regulatory protein AtoC [Desulfosarcina ovata subsp. sediminis]|uniref:Acetoacetate metabolism regulatory protein AtoC n=1 Tax=Desulfosarcina ovata subsp. sediminis TaxID=885957 RepID=A0A5K7ZS63_9BACT|nr:sigma-54 dependent transcriptional regulator [Desulfosarcina ovata]BBO83057.1 acetoacetate metabolism regulatory protein AtoC [Desulfosarcina ovata subsp. sediminis]